MTLIQNCTNNARKVDMGRIKNSGTSNGTAGSPQISLEQEQLANDMAQAEQQLVQET